MSLLHTMRTTKPGQSLRNLIPTEWSWEHVLEYLSTTEGKRKSWNLWMHSLDQEDLPYEVLQAFLRSSFIKIALATPTHVILVFLRAEHNLDEIYDSVWDTVIERRYWRSRVHELIEKLLKEMRTHLFISHLNVTRHSLLALRFILKKRAEANLGNPCDWLFGFKASRSEYYRLESSSSPILNRIGSSRRAILNFIHIFFDKAPAMVTSNDVVKYNLLDSAIHYLHDPEFLKKLIQICPLALSIKTKLGHSKREMVLPIQRSYFSFFGIHRKRGLQLLSKEIFKIILHAGITHNVGGEHCVGGLFEDVVLLSQYSAVLDGEGCLFERIFSYSGSCDCELSRICLEVPNSILVLAKGAHKKGLGWKYGSIIPLCLWHVVVEDKLDLLDQRDTHTGLLPFMLAATLFSLDISYELLRHNPSCLRNL